MYVVLPIKFIKYDITQITYIMQSKWEFNNIIKAFSFD